MIEPYMTLYKEHHSVGKHFDGKVRVFIDSLLRNNSPKIYAYMNDSYNRDHIQILNSIQRKGSFQIHQTIPCNKVKMIHSGFRASRQRNQNEFTNLANNISILSIKEGVVL